MTNRDPYEIPAEIAETVKSHVGQTMTAKGRAIKVLRWEGQNYIIQTPDGAEHSMPVMFVLQEARNAHAVWSN